MFSSYWALQPCNEHLSDCKQSLGLAVEVVDHLGGDTRIDNDKFVNIVQFCHSTQVRRFIGGNATQVWVLGC